MGGTSLGSCSAGADALDSKFLLQTNTTWLLRKANGLYQGNGGGRAFGLAACKKGQIITIVTSGGAPTAGTNVTETSSGTTSVFTVTEDGPVKFNLTRYYYIKTIKIEENVVSGDQKPTTYTVKFVDGNGIELKDALTFDSYTNEDVTASATEMASFVTEDGQKYIYKEGNTTITLVEDAVSNMITLVFRKAEKFAYALKNSFGTTIKSGEDWEGETINVAYPRYLVQEGTLYSSEHGDAGWYLKKVTLNQNNQEETINYTATETTDVVFFSEAEDIETLSVSTAANSNVRCSMGLGAYNVNEDDAVIAILPAGKYMLYTSTWGGTGVDFVFKAGENIIGTFAGFGYIKDYNTEEFELYAESTPITLGQTRKDRCIDFVYIVKTGDVASSIEVSVGESGLSTYCPTVDLDFSASLNINAYAAKINGDVVELTKVNTVKAGEGILLSTEGQGAQTEEIAIASATEDNANDFIGVIEAMVLPEAADGDVNYVLSKKDGVVGFFRANNTNIAAGKAYLKVPTEAAAKGLKMVFGDTTGINEVAAPAKNDGAFYTLSGVRVENPVKGVYIQNGKKVVVK